MFLSNRAFPQIGCDGEGPLGFLEERNFFDDRRGLYFYAKAFFFSFFFSFFDVFLS